MTINMQQVTEKAGLVFVHEVFADRAYEKDGSLRSRKLEGAVLEEEMQVLKQVKAMVQKGQVLSYTGQKINVKADTICLHSDTTGAVQLAKSIHNMLTANGIDILTV